MTEVQHRGDDLRRELVHFLSTTLITPIDREDIYRISRSIDDVLDNLRDSLTGGSKTGDVRWSPEHVHDLWPLPGERPPTDRGIPGLNSCC